MTPRSAHARVFADLVAKARQECLEGLAHGLDERTYLEVVGVIRGYDDAIKLSEEADLKLSGGMSVSA